MSKKKYCPICDQPITGRFCKHCMEFVKPYEHEVDYHMNESHDPKNDIGCDYHGTNLQSKGEKASSDKVRMEQAKKSFESHGDVRFTSGQTGKVHYNSEQTSSARNSSSAKPLKVILTVWIVMLVLGVVVNVVAVVSNLYRQPEVDIEHEDISVESVDTEFAKPDDMDYPFYGDDYMSDDEYESRLLEEGYDSNGYKEADLDEIIEAGEPCNGYIHFDLQSRTALRHVLNALNDEDISASEYYTDSESSNYFYMNQWGDVYSYFESRIYATINNPLYEDGYDGYITIVSDTVTDQLMCVRISEDDLDTFAASCMIIMKELDETCKYDLYSFKDDISSVIDYGEDNYDYFYYGDLVFYIDYYTGGGDYYPYYAEIYLDYSDEM